MTSSAPPCDESGRPDDQRPFDVSQFHAEGFTKKQRGAPVRRREALRLGIGAVTFAPLLSPNPQAYYAYDALYYALTFGPAGMLISRAATTRRRSLRLWASPAAVAVCVLTLETILVMASGRVVVVSNLLWGFVFGSASVATRELLSLSATRVRQRETD